MMSPLDHGSNEHCAILQGTKVICLEFAWGMFIVQQKANRKVALVTGPVASHKLVPRSWPKRLGIWSA